MMKDNTTGGTKRQRDIENDTSNKKQGILNKDIHCVFGLTRVCM